MLCWGQTWNCYVTDARCFSVFLGERWAFEHLAPLMLGYAKNLKLGLRIQLLIGCITVRNFFHCQEQLYNDRTELTQDVIVARAILSGNRCPKVSHSKCMWG